jgi:hypothetical protein
MNKRKYPTSLFIFGFTLNVIFHYFFLFVPGFILIIVGIFNKYCLVIGLAILVIDLIISLIDQLNIRNTFLKDSDHPGFQEFQDAISRGGDWKKNIRNLVDEKIKKYSDEEEE